MRPELHDYKSILANCERKLQESTIPAKNKEIILKFKQYLIVRNYSLVRIIKYLSMLRIVSTVVPKSFDEYTKDDIFTFIEHLHTKGSKEWTKLSYNAIIKRFFKWFKGNDTEYPELVKNIQIHMSACKTSLPNEGELLTEEEVILLLNHTKNARDKALVSILWESGARVAEIATLRIRDVAFDKFGGLISVQGKTGSRKLRLISSIPYLAAWLAYHPCKDDVDAPMWATVYGSDKGKLLKYSTHRKILKDLFKRAGIKKRSNPHSFRHARATFLANHLTEFQMNQYFGWVQGSNMPSTYVHLSGKNTDEALLKLNGIKLEKTEERSKLLPKTCIRCTLLNGQDAFYCTRCGCILDSKTAVEQTLKDQEIEDKQVLLGKVLEDLEIRNLISKRLKEMKKAELYATLS